MHWRSILLVTLISSVTCQDAAEPSAALEPGAAAELLPEHVSDVASETAALLPLSEAAKAQLVESMMMGVQASKDEVKQALANPNAAFEQYSGRWATGDVGVASVPAPGSVTDTKTLAQRKRIFLANLRRYARLNAQNPDVSHGITPFTHLTQAEFQATMLPRDFSQQYSVRGAHTAGRGSLGRRLKACGDPLDNPYTVGTPPPSVNWVTASMLPPIRTQGTCASCAAFATTALAEFSYIKKKSLARAQRSSVNFSEQDLMNCAAGDQCTGAPVDLYVQRIMCSAGMANETAVPYNGTDTDACKSPARVSVGMAGYAWVDNYNPPGLELAVAKAPTMVAVGANTWQGYTAGYLGLQCQPDSTINHAVVVVGYFNGVTVNNRTIDAFIIRNSWSTSWGGSNASPYKGYAFVRKDCPGAGAYNMYAWPHIVPIVG